MSAPQLDTRAFFDVALPQIAARQAAAFCALSGSVSFTIAGAGAWTVHLGDPERPVSAGLEENADLTLFFTDQAFEHLLQSRLDFEAALERRAVGYKGDIGLLEKIGFLLTRGGNADDVMVDQVPIGMKRA